MTKTDLEALGRRTPELAQDDEDLVGVEAELLGQPLRSRTERELVLGPRPLVRFECG
jgi:hypothetical protein